MNCTKQNPKKTTNHQYRVKINLAIYNFLKLKFKRVFLTNKKT